MDAAVAALGELVPIDGGAQLAPNAFAPRYRALLEVAGLFPPLDEAVELEGQLRERGFDSHLGVQDRGFGGQDLELFRYGSAVSCHAHLRSWNGLRTALTMTCSGPPQTLELRAAILGPAVRSAEAGLQVRYEWPEHRRGMDRHREDVLGSAPPVDVHPELRRSFGAAHSGLVGVSARPDQLQGADKRPAAYERSVAVGVGRDERASVEREVGTAASPRASIRIGDSHP